MEGIILSDASSIYALTTGILGVGSLIMAITLLTLHRALRNSGRNSKLGLIYLALAMFVLSLVNLFEYATGIDMQREKYSLSVVVFAASVELFLIFSGYMSMLYSPFITKKRLCLELLSIGVFTTPALLFSSERNPLLFNVLFTIGIIFYGSKLIANVIEYQREIKRTRLLIENCLSYDSREWLKWINKTFYIVLAIGITSVIAPMTNMLVLVYYNSFLFFAYLYVYILVILNISIFDKGMSILESDDDETDETSKSVNPSLPPTSGKKVPTNLNSSQKKNLDDWIKSRGYAVAGVSATEVALQLGTNRTKLSYHIKHELNTSYYEWIAQLRVEDAKRQLRECPNRTIYEIAQNVGIEDRDNFRRLFQRIVGMPPSAYRKQYEEQNY